MAAPQSLDADVIILGGGCAGLSLATRLAMADDAPRALVLEARQNYEEDRTWCGWRLEPHVYADCVVAEWNKWIVQNAEQRVLRSSSRYMYEMVNSGLFYRASCQKISESQNVAIRMNVDVRATGRVGNDFTVELANGQHLKTGCVIDTRPQRRTLASPWLWQDFVGYVVEVEPEVAAHLGSCPVLMDFQAPGGAVIQFMYILPISCTTYLCEWTAFSSQPVSIESLEMRLKQWLTQNVCNYRKMRREYGSLPMAPPQRQERDGVIRAGTSGGSMRASTGYAFHSIQRWADQCATSLLAGHAATAPGRSAILETLDGVFLHALVQAQGAASRFFLTLFERTDADSLVRFLAGQPTSKDTVAVLRALPWPPLIKAAASAALPLGA